MTPVDSMKHILSPCFSSEDTYILSEDYDELIHQNSLPSYEELYSYISQEESFFNLIETMIKDSISHLETEYAVILEWNWK